MADAMSLVHRLSSSGSSLRGALPSLHFPRRIPCLCKAPLRVVSMAMPGPIARPDDPFLARLAAAAQTPLGQAQLAQSSTVSNDNPPLLNIVTDPLCMAAPAQVERATSYNEHRPRKPPPDLPSLLLNSRIVYIGMPLVAAVTELVIAELLYLQWLDPRQPTYVYINSTGTSRADGETVGMETEGFAIYDTMMLVKNEIQTVAVGAAIGQACLLLAAGEKGKRYMLPHAKAMIQQPRLPSLGQMPASDIQIRAKEVVNNRDTLVSLLAKHTGNSFKKVAKIMQRPYYMEPRKAVEFGVADKILWRGQEAMSETLTPEQWDKKAGIRVLERPMTYGAGNSGLG
ncbi:hypothetical protein O6H91_11G055200 [Diphasiastrum complanatum]|uniref:Uncharacterized protein n=1 Tax=Diphasiastrum complanatum TaxID=34168 RepID=A0ACC2CAB7_DIPCM|nr:hypothetical protein O6H91_11G055200 [Diphasiastrum complanatum]